MQTRVEDSYYNREELEYVKAVREEALIHSDGSFPGRLQKLPVRFGYGTVSLEAFEKQHSSNGRLWRKVTAVPFAMVAVLKVVKDLIVAALSGLDSYKPRIPRVRKACLFSCVRDLEEAAGRIVGLFNDVKGSYLTQHALFQKNYYDCACGFSVYGAFDAYDDTRNSEEAEKITLSEFRGLSEIAKQHMIEKLGLKDIIDKFDQFGGFGKVLENADSEMLKLVTVNDLMLGSKRIFLKGEFCDIPEFLRPKEDLLRISVKDFPIIVTSQDNATGIGQKFRRRLLDEGVDIEEESQKDIPSMSFATFLHLPSSTLDERVSSIPSWCYSYLSDEQAEKIDLSKLSDDQMNHFLGNVDKDMTKRRARYERVPSAWIQTHVAFFQADEFDLFSDEQIKRLDLAVITSKQLVEKVFPPRRGTKQNHRIGLLTREQINAGLHKFTSYHFPLFSDEQIAWIDVKQMTKEDVYRVFLGAEERLWNLFSPEDKKIILNMKGVISPFVQEKQYQLRNKSVS